MNRHRVTAEQLIGVIMTQLFPADHTDVLDKLRVTVYQAIER